MNYVPSTRTSILRPNTRLKCRAFLSISSISTSPGANVQEKGNHMRPGVHGHVANGAVPPAIERGRDTEDGRETDDGGLVGRRKLGKILVARIGRLLAVI